MPTIYTIGHSTKTLEELTARLIDVGIETLLDVRSRPYSRWNPQFNEPTVKRALTLAGVAYEPRGKNLGGLDRNVEYEATLDLLAHRAGQGEVMAVMCSEGPYQKCHRNSMLTPQFLRRGLDVGHIEWSGKVTTITHQGGASSGSISLHIAPREEPVPMFDLEPEPTRRFGGFIAP